VVGALILEWVWFDIARRSGKEGRVRVVELGGVVTVERRGEGIGNGDWSH
jgi:hypothetical protein